MTEKNKPQQSVEIQRIYVKELSLESPSSPKIFEEKWQPEVTIDLDIKNEKVKDHIFEVVLSVTATAKMEDKVIFLAEVHQAGVFLVQGFEKEQEDHILGAFCPTVIFPYAREVISDLVVRGSFPQLNLAPVNFEMMYMQQKEAKKDA